ncbi:unannotated protein [freshwater metagenome]|uniref:Unannotated protein n=1 Tax=freshwater metagenome TaxID=449393 RepID=A0A6J6I0Y1_9ZZZZ
MPTIGEVDFVAMNHGREKQDLSVGIEHEVAVINGKEPSADKLGMTSAGTEIP